MGPFVFEKRTEDDLYVYHYDPRGADLFQETWPGLHTDWPEDRAMDTRIGELGYYRCACHVAAVYLGLAWRLSRGLTRFAIPLFRGYDIGRARNVPFDRVRWEYELLAEEMVGPTKDNGFVRAQSPYSGSWFRNPLRPFHLKPRGPNQAALLEVRSFADFFGFYDYLFNDASAEMNLFCLATDPDRRTALVETLQSKQKPTLAAILEPGELLIDITIAEKLGYFDSILIKSASDIGPELDELVAWYSRTISDYEARAAHIRDWDEFFSVLEHLALGDLQE